MKPEVDRLLEVAALHLLTRIAPELKDAYAQGSLTVIAILLGAAREEFERGAARRVEENAALRRLFARALPAVEDADLRSRLEDAAGSCDPQLRIPELEGENTRLRGLLIDLHAHVEEQAGPEARQVEEAIWEELAASTERRRLAMGAF